MAKRIVVGEIELACRYHLHLHLNDWSKQQQRNVEKMMETEAMNTKNCKILLTKQIITTNSKHSEKEEEEEEERGKTKEKVYGSIERNWIVTLLYTWLFVRVLNFACTRLFVLFVFFFLLNTLGFQNATVRPTIYVLEIVSFRQTNEILLWFLHVVEKKHAETRKKLGMRNYWNYIHQGAV